MKKSILVLLLVVFTFFTLSAVEYLSEEEWKQLKKKERELKNQEYEAALEKNMKTKSDAIAEKEMLTSDIAKLKEDIKAIDTENEQVYNEILSMLNVDKSSIKYVEQQISKYEKMIANWESLSDDELWNANKNIKQFKEEYNAYKNTNEAKIPDFRARFSDLDRKILSLDRALENARPRYYEDEYAVKEGDYLAKISGYSFIYNDPSKWGIIYRANRDQISDPNVISVNQVLKIPRGLPNQWKVWKGESLWKIASYPEVYGNGMNWPKIYRANKDKIKDPNLIYPNQKFEIPRD